MAAIFGYGTSGITWSGSSTTNTIRYNMSSYSNEPEVKPDKVPAAFNGPNCRWLDQRVREVCEAWK